MKYSALGSQDYIEKKNITNLLSLYLILKHNFFCSTKYSYNNLYNSKRKYSSYRKFPVETWTIRTVHLVQSTNLKCNASSCSAFRESYSVPYLPLLKLSTRNLTEFREVDCRVMVLFQTCVILMKTRFEYMFYSLLHHQYDTRLKKKLSRNSVKFLTYRRCDWNQYRNDSR